MVDQPRTNPEIVSMRLRNHKDHRRSEVGKNAATFWDMGKGGWGEDGRSEDRTPRGVAGHSFNLEGEIARDILLYSSTGGSQ